MTALFLILFGYLLGSVSPAFILGKVLRGIDIRRYGTHNAGTRNVKKVLGLWPAVVTVIFDLAKGLVAMLVASHFQASETIIFATGYAAVLGHIFPFYLNFRGGEGSATGVAILLFALTKAILHHWLDYSIFLPLVLLAMIIMYITSLGEIVGLFILPALALLLLLTAPLNPTIIIIAILLIQLFIVTLYNIKKLKLLNFGKHKLQFWRWRTVLRPLATIFVILPFYLDRTILLYFVGAVALVFIIFDLTRFISGKFNQYLYRKTTTLLKQKEAKQFSSMTFFLTAIFILLLVFPLSITGLAILFLIYGDVAAKFFGLLFGRHRFFSKTLEGSLAYFGFAFFCGFIFLLYQDFPLWLMTIGALTAALTEALSIFTLDDNFMVGLISAAVMLAFSTLI